MNENPNDLLNTPYLPPFHKGMRALARTAKAYYNLNPYPSHSTMTSDKWKVEDRGPYPRCRPLPQIIVNKSATWLFGKPVTYTVPDEEGKNNDDQSKLINDTMTSNDMTRRLRVAAVCASNAGGFFLKWSYDEANEKRPVQIDLLDPSEQIYLYWSDEDLSKLLMCRIQFPFLDKKTGTWMWHREEYTDDWHWIYDDQPMANFTQDTDFKNPYVYIEKAEEYQQWTIQEANKKRNEFMIIPGWYVKNRDVGGTFGEGELWTMFEIIDQINFTHDLAHKDNQKSIDPDKTYIDLTTASGDQPMADNSKVESLESKSDKTQGKVEVYQSNAAMREPINVFAKDLEHELLTAVGSVNLDPADITNKGNLTSTVMTLMYAPLIERTDEKHQVIGEDGVCVFLERMSIGLSNIGAKGWEPMDDIQMVWPPYFRETEEEKATRVTRLVMEVDNALTTHERAVKEIASADNIVDVDAFINEVSKEKVKADAKEDAMDSAMMRQGKALGGK